MFLQINYNTNFSESQFKKSVDFCRFVCYSVNGVNEMNKGFIGALLSTVIVISGVACVISQKENKEGFCRYSDIAAYINNYPVKSFNIEGYTAVNAADLNSYGFDVTWDEAARHVSIERGTGEISPPGAVYKDANRAGMPAKQYVLSDITADMRGKTVKCYNVDGRTVIKFDDLNRFGKVRWDSKAREISLTVSGIPMGEKKPVEENPNVVTMYASDGRTLIVGTDEVEAYKKVNWHEDISEVTATLYSKDGRTLTVFQDEVPVYLGLNWYRYKPGSRLIALTFDDGPSRYTPIILDKLQEYGAKATFFVVGSRVSKYADILKRESDMGMEIGSHSWDHAKLSQLSADAVKLQKTQTDDAVRQITGKNTTLVRPPYGSKNQTVLDAFNLPVILWSVDTLDWKTRSVKSTVDNVMRNAKDGDIVLMHDIYEQSANAAAELIPKLIDEGYELVTVSEMAAARGGLQNGRVYHAVRQ